MTYRIELRKDEELRNHWILGVLLLFSALLLVACGTNSKDDVLKKTSNKWTTSKGYELDATMDIKTGAEPRTYDVNVWHTKPDFYRVSVNQQGEDSSQMIIRNEDGVFVVTPSLKKTYKFQSDWPKQNSQGYLIGALAEDLKADKNAKMTESDKAYVFETKTRNNHSKMLPYQQIYIDKKTLLPTKASILNDAKEEQVLITFKKISIGTARKSSEYAVEDFTKKDTADTKATNSTEKSSDQAKEQQGSTDTNKNDTVSQDSSDPTSDPTFQEGSDTASKDNKDTANKEATGAEIDSKDFQTHYPVLKWDNVKLVDEKTVSTDERTRTILTFDGDKAFTVIEEPVATENHLYIPVFSPGDPADLGFTIGAITDKSISWEKNGVSFFIATNSLSREEMVEVATSMVNGEIK